MGYSQTGLLADPQYRKYKASLAARGRLTAAHHIAKLGEHASELTDEQRERLTEIVASAPAPTAEQIDKLRALLPAPTSNGGDAR